MDYIKLSSIQSSSQFNFSHSHNQISKVIKFLLSISVFSILLSYSSLASLLLHFFSSFSSSSSMNLLSYTFDKNSMFLLCNGLLVFIVKNSGLIGTSPPGFTSNLSNDDEVISKNSESPKTVVPLAGKTSEKKAEEAKEEIVNVEVEEEGVREDEILVRVEEEDHEVYEEEGVELLSAEELKKKCDEFIRKMKQGIKLEVEQSIIS